MSNERWFAHARSVRDENGLTVAHCTAKTDAILAAAAPRMLKTLQDALHWLEKYQSAGCTELDDDMLDDMRAAIAEAKDGVA